MASVRIYAFAKELGLDNKQLLDICESCGIKGKGSALASLDDNEVAQIKKHMTDGPSSEPEPPTFESPGLLAAEAAAAESAANAEPDPPAPAEEPETAPESAPAPAASSAPGPLAKRSGGGSSSKTDASPTSSSPAPPVPPLRRKPLDSTPVRGNSLLSNMRERSGGVRDLNQKPRKNGGDDAKREKREPKKKPPLNVKLAEMPKVQQPSARSTHSGEKVQKPDIALPQDAIAKAKSGSAAPLEQFTRSKTDKPKKKGGRAGAAGGKQVFGEMPTPLGDKRGGGSRRGEKGGKAVDTGLGSTRQARPKRRRVRPGFDRGDDRYYRNRRQRSGPRANTAAPRKEDVELQLPCTVREFSEAAGVAAVQVLLTAKQLGDETNRTINSPLEDCLLYTSPSPRDQRGSRMPSSA